MIFQIALTILDNQSIDLLDCGDDAEAVPILSGYLARVTNRDSTMPNVIHTNAMSSGDAADTEVSKGSCRPATFILLQTK